MLIKANSPVKLTYELEYYTFKTMKSRKKIKHAINYFLNVYYERNPILRIYRFHSLQRQRVGLNCSISFLNVLFRTVSFHQAPLLISSV